MRVTKAIIATAKRVEAIQSAAYQTGSKIVDGLNGPYEARQYTELADFPYNDPGQTPRQLCSFTASLAHLISVEPSFITGLTEEAAHYISPESADEYIQYLRRAAVLNNLQLPEQLESAA